MFSHEVYEFFFCFRINVAPSITENYFHSAQLSFSKWETAVSSFKSANIYLLIETLTIHFQWHGISDNKTETKNKSNSIILFFVLESFCVPEIVNRIKKKYMKRCMTKRCRTIIHGIQMNYQSITSSYESLILKKNLCFAFFTATKITWPSF